MATSTRHVEQDLWVITCYFNQFRFQRRLLNYHLFRRYLTAPLIAVELSFDGSFDLLPNDADILIPLEGKDVMWQKERLLNIAIHALPVDCRKVVFMDCDTILGASDWPERVSSVLDEFPVVQPFDRAYHLVRDAHLKDFRASDAVAFEQQSIPVAVAAGRPASECMSGFLNGPKDSYVMGMGWAVRREVLDLVELYDACIVGGGSRAFVSGAYGCFEETIRMNQMNTRQRDHYLAWATKFFQVVQGGVGSIECALYHLWHGDIANRQYGKRFQGLNRFNFDPYVDLDFDQNGVWRWNSDKAEMHQYVRDYLAARKEDG